MSSHGPCFLLAISLILRSKNILLVLFTVLQKDFQSSRLFNTLYFLRSLLQLLSHQLLECLIILVHFVFLFHISSTLLVSSLTMFSNMWMFMRFETFKFLIMWWMVWCEPLHLIHLAFCILQTPTVWPYFQQFLYWRMSGFMLTPQIVVMNLPMLNLWLMRDLALEPLWAFHMSIHIMAMLDFRETFIILSLEARTTLLKMWVFLRTLLISSKVIQELVTSDRYEMPTIFK